MRRHGKRIVLAATVAVGTAAAAGALMGGTAGGAATAPTGTVKLANGYSGNFVAELQPVLAERDDAHERDRAGTPVLLQHHPGR